MEKIQPQVGANQDENEEDEDSAGERINHHNQHQDRGRDSSPPSRQAEEERIMAILERIQSMKQADYKRFLLKVQIIFNV